VAVLWTWAVAAANHIRLPWTALTAMGLAVWLLYAADRLLDARLSEDARDLEARHHFHHLHRRAFRAGIIFVSIALAALLPKLAPEAIHLYLVLGGLVFGHFVAIHAADPADASHLGHRLPKELAVGFFFSAAVFIPTVSRQPALRLALLPVATLFAVLCSLNCLYIYAWEHPTPSRLAPHPATRQALRFLSPITIGLAFLSLVLAIADRRALWPIPAACGLSSILLLAIHHNRNRIAPTTLRAAADLCLLTPILFRLLAY
jgi:hypothetical protein